MPSTFPPPSSKRLAFSPWEDTLSVEDKKQILRNAIAVTRGRYKGPIADAMVARYEARLAHYEKEPT